MRPKIAILYSLARSGATLMTRCLGCAADNVILSEINPRFSWFNPLIQAYEWYGLFSPSEMIQFRARPDLGYTEAILAISERCRAKGLHLIIRDWTHIDYTPGDYPVTPIYQPAQELALGDAFEIQRVSITRHPLDAYLSVCKVPRMAGQLSLSQYMEGFLKFAELAMRTGFIRYEDFCRQPPTVLRSLSERLGVGYADDFETRYLENNRVTGDIYHPDATETVTGERVGERSGGRIRLPERRRIPDAVREQLDDCPPYSRILQLLGYDQH